MPRGLTWWRICSGSGDSVGVGRSSLRRSCCEVAIVVTPSARSACTPATLLRAIWANAGEGIHGGRRRTNRGVGRHEELHVLLPVQQARGARELRSSVGGMAAARVLLRAAS